MVIRKQQRSTHSSATRVSGRARELEEKGFYFLKYHPDGAKLADVWDILPEDSQGRSNHFAPYPEDLCRIPILSTCPKDGIVLDPFIGTGTTCLVAMKLGRKSVGIDISESYLEEAKQRLAAYRGLGLE
jgi:site-specific DNA-methyltransferase (adenine-specific)